MKYLLTLFLSGVLFACNNGSAAGSAAEPPAESPDITVQIENAPQGKAYLIATFTDQNYRLDSAMVAADGQMQFQRDTPYPSGLLYLLLPDQSYLQLLVDRDQTFTLRTRHADLVGSMAVEGSLDNKLLYQNLRFEAELQPQFRTVAQQLKSTTPGTAEHDRLRTRQQQLTDQRRDHLEAVFTSQPDAFYTAFKKAGQNPDVPPTPANPALQVYRYRTQFWDNVDFSDERLLRTPVIANKLRRYINELTVQNPDSIIASARFLIDQVTEHPEYYKFFVNWIALNYEPTETTLMDPQAVYVFMVQNYITYERAFWTDSTEIYALQLRAHEMASSLVGQKGPDVRANDPNGRPRAISDITAPYVVVYLYNPTCEHCMEETPKLLQFYREWKAKGLEVYAIAVDTDNQEWRDYIAQNNMNWINVFDPTNKAIYAKYFVDITPEIYVLNADRTIIAKNLKTEQIAEVIRKDQQQRGDG